jgi:hypothetical protein
MTTPVAVIKTDPVWFKNFYVLFKSDRVIEFFPNRLQTLEERMNSVARLGVYSGILLTVYKRDYRFLAIIPVVLAMTYIIYKRYHVITNKADTIVGATKSILKSREVRPTIDNPFMNPSIDDYAKNTDRPAAKTYYEDTKEAEDIRNAVKDSFEFNLYREVDDVYEKNNSDRQFYTMPNTQIPTAQEEYLEFLYGDMATNCKTDTSKCVPYEDIRANPVIFPNQNENPVVSKE